MHIKQFTLWIFVYQKVFSSLTLLVHIFEKLRAVLPISQREFLIGLR